MIKGENSAIHHSHNEKGNLYFAAILGDSCSYLLFTSTASKYAKRSICCVEHLCLVLWRLFLYLKTDEQGTKHFLCAAVISKALCQSCEAYWEKTSGESASISGSSRGSGCSQFSILPGYYLASNSHFKACYFKLENGQVLAKSDVAL